MIRLRRNIFGIRFRSAARRREDDFGKKLLLFFSQDSASDVVEEIAEKLDIRGEADAAIEHYMEHDFDADSLDLDSKIEDQVSDYADDKMRTIAEEVANEAVQDHERDTDHLDGDDYVSYSDFDSAVNDKVAEAVEEQTRSEIQDALESHPDLDRKLSEMVQTVVKENLGARELRQVISTVVRASVVSEINQREKNHEAYLDRRIAAAVAQATPALVEENPIVKVVNTVGRKVSAIVGILLR
jgi:hypothetical protein